MHRSLQESAFWASEPCCPKLWGPNPPQTDFFLGGGVNMTFEPERENFRFL